MPSAAAPIETLLFRKDYETAAPAHSHNYLELVFPLDAPLQVHLEDLDMFRVHPGEVLLVPAFLSHSLQADRLHQRWLVLRLHLHKLHLMLAGTLYGGAIERFHQTGNHGRLLLNHAATEVWRHTNALGEHGTLHDLHHLAALLALVCSPCLPEDEWVVPRKRRSDREITFCNALNELIEADPAHVWSLDRLAQHFHMSKSTFCRTVRKNLGLPFHHWLLDKKIRLACLYLQQSDQSVQSIAVQLGFSSATYFTKVFKKHVGHTPSSFRLPPEPVPQPERSPIQFYR